MRGKTRGGFRINAGRRPGQIPASLLRKPHTVSISEGVWKKAQETTKHATMSRYVECLIRKDLGLSEDF